MQYVRIRSYYPDGRFTFCEHLYSGADHVSAILRFRSEYPAHHNCILVAETIDADDPKNKEYFSVCLRCGCVH